MFENYLNLRRRYELSYGITITLSNVFRICLYAICSAHIQKHIKYQMDLYIFSELISATENSNYDYIVYGY